MISLKLFFIVCIIALILCILLLIFLHKYEKSRRSPKVDSKPLEEVISLDKQEEVPTIVNEEVNDNTSLTTEKEVILVRYRKSFNAQLILQPHLRAIYQKLNDEFLAYKKVHTRLSFRGVRISYGRTLLAKMFVRGKRIYVYYAFDSNTLPTKYHLRDVSDKKIGQELPSLQRVLSGRSILYAKELIAILMEKNGITRLPLEKITNFDYTKILKPRSFKQLLEEGLIVEYNIKKVVDDNYKVEEKKLEVTSDEIDDYVLDEELEISIKYDHQNNKGKMAIINIGQINEYFDEEDVIDLAVLKEKGLVKNNARRLKVLANGTLDKGLTVKADEFSKQAMKMIIYMGGTVVVLK